MQFFDTHAHIGLIYDDPIEQLRVITQARLAGVTRIVSINNSLIDFKKVYQTLKAIPGIYHAVGVAPSEVTTPGKDWISTIEESLSLPNVVAVGETGLDYFKQFGDKRTQMELFITQLELAEKHQLPVIIHNRDAGKDIFDVVLGMKDKFHPSNITASPQFSLANSLVASDILFRVLNEKSATPQEALASAAEEIKNAQ